MSYITAAFPPPSILSNEGAAWASNLTTTISANAVLLFVFSTPVPITITGVRWHMGGTATGKTNMGIYTLAGALVPGSDTGQVSNVASSDNTSNYATPLVLAPGQYFMAIACSNGSDTYLGRAAGAITGVMRARVASNSVAAGALPATTGTINTTQTIPACALLVQGGLA